MALLVAMPWLMFLMIFIAFSFAYHHYDVIVWSLVLALVMVSLVFMILSSRLAGSWYPLLSMLCMIACGNACLAGLYNYHTHMFQYWSYDENRAYTNVLPSEPASAHADAGKIVFANTARVDTTRAVGYKAGATYCVAPILDDTQLDRVEFFAAGLDCCPSRGDFTCDDAWSPTAKSGVVILDSDGFFPAKRDYYLKAVKQAAAAFQMVAAEHPILVRWVADPQLIQDGYWSGGVGFLVGMVFAYLFVSIVAGAVLSIWVNKSANATGAS